MRARHTVFLLVIAVMSLVAGCGDNGGGNSNGLRQAVAGQDIYDGNCESCHSLSTYDPDGSPDLAGVELATLQSLPDIPEHDSISLDVTETENLAVWVNADFIGKEIYDDRCRSCHKLGVYDPSGSEQNLAGRNVINAHRLGGVSTTDREHLNDWVHTP